MPSVFLFNYPDTATEPADLSKFILKKSNDIDVPSDDKIKKLNESRSRMVTLLNSQPNTKAILDVIDEYVPELISILPYIENYKLQNAVKFKWRSSLSASVRTTLSGSFVKPFVKSYSIYYEIIYAQMAYAFILSNMALKNAASDSSDDTLNIAINNICKASGIFHSLSVSYASTWTVQDGPPETTVDYLSALADLALGDAQQLACVKAERKNLSSGAIFKLKAGVVSKYEKCYKTLRQFKDDYEDLSVSFKSHVTHVMKFSEGNLLLLMAKLHAENEDYGVAAAEITGAHNLFIDCREAENASLKVMARELSGETRILHANYTKTNNNVTYQKVPDLEFLRNEYLGSCRIIVEPKLVNFGHQL